MAPATPAEPIAPGVAPLPAALPGEAGPAASETRLVVGAEGEVLVDSIAPHWVLAPRLFVEVGSATTALLSPQGGLSVAGTSTDVEGEVGDAKLLWLAARAEGCPLNLTSNDTVGLRPCLTFEGGILRGVGRNNPDPPTLEESSSANRTWLAAGVLLRLQVALAPWIELRGDGGLSATLLQPSFVFSRPGGEEVIHEAPAWAPYFGLGVGLPLLP
jgi:hypothetical protein